jgi:PleD family two-component response regulator
MVSSPNVLPGPGVPRRVTVLTIWTVSDTLSVLVSAWQLMSALPALLEGTEKDAWGHCRLAWHVMCRDVEEDVHSSTKIRQEGQGYMATQAPMLIVDGNPQMTAMLQRFLARQQVDAQAVLSPAEAQLVLAQRPFRVVLTDYFAPSGDGLALLHSIRQTQYRKSHPVPVGGSPDHC